MERPDFEHWKPKEVARLLALVETERRYYQEMVATLPVPVAVLTATRQVASANRAFRRTVGMRSDELRNKLIEQILPSDALVERIRSAHNQGEIEPLVLNMGDRRFRVAVMPIQNWEDELEAETLLILEDLTGLPERPVALAAPPVSAAPNPVESAPAVVWQADTESMSVRTVQGAVESMLGYPAEHWISTPRFLFERIHPADRDAVTVIYDAVARAGGEASAEFRAITASGEAIWCRETVRVSDPDVAPSRMTGVMTNIGRRRQLEMQSLASARMDALRHLAGRLAHDLNNPLMIVTGYGEEMLAGMTASDPMRADLQQILTAAGKITQVTGNLLDFSQQFAKPASKVNVSELVGEMHGDLLRVSAESVPVDVDADPHVLTIADSSQLHDAILTLAVSALEHTHQATELQVSCQTDLIAEHVEPATLKPGAYTRIDILAVGEGLDADAKSAEIRNAIFEGFLPAKGGGQTGQSVARTYSMIRQWGGDIVFSSDATTGSAFVIYLPYVEPEPGVVLEMPSAKAEEASAAEPARELSRGTILVVDDEDGIRALMKKNLLREHFSVMEAASAEEAIEVAAAHGEQIDVLLTDIMLPGMKGTELASKMQALDPNLKVVFVSGYAGEDGETTVAGLPPGVQLLRKPFALGALTAAIYSALKGTA